MLSALESAHQLKKMRHSYGSSAVRCSVCSMFSSRVPIVAVRRGFKVEIESMARGSEPEVPVHIRVLLTQRS